VQRFVLTCSCAAGIVFAACFTGGTPSVPDAGDAGDDASDGGVASLFSAKCGLIGCHAGPDAPLGLDLTVGGYMPSLVGVPAAEVLGELRVAPGLATDTQSYLLCKIDPECAITGQRMPLGGALDADEIALVRAWVASLPIDPDAGPPPTGIDATPPKFAGATSATAGPSSITLAWTAATDDTDAPSDLVYLVYEGSSAGAEDFGAPALVTPPGATGVAIGKLSNSSTRWFVVRAEDLAGNVDANTIEVSATTPAIADATPPTFGGATSATTQSAGSIALAWAAATDDVSAPPAIGYLVYASTTSGGESFATPDLVTLAGATGATVSGLGGDTKYWFVVRAIDAAGNVDANVAEVSATTAHVSFAGDVAPIFGATCASAGCHVQPNPAENLDLATPAAAYAALVGGVSDECSAMSLVAPGAPKTSYLLQKLRGYGSCFTGTRMPEQAPALDAPALDLVSAWIGKGAPND
jgi:hypothetical protein